MSHWGDGKGLFMSRTRPRTGSVIVVGGGVGGMQAALDLAEAGIKVHLVEKEPAIGGVMSLIRRKRS